MGEHELARRDLVGEARAALTQQLAVEQQPFVAHGTLSLRCFSLGACGLYHSAMPTGEAELGLEAARFPRHRDGRRRRRLAAAVLLRLADLLLPPVCISCRRRIVSHGPLCGACFASIDFIAPPICARLGVPLPYEAGEPRFGGGDRHPASLRPRAGRGALFGHHARAYPGLQISRSA